MAVAIVRQETDELVQAAISARQKAESAETSHNKYRWLEADAYVALKEKGWTVRQIAEACGTNKDAVSRFIRCVELCIGTDTRPKFWDAYSEVTGENDKAVHVSHNSGENEWYTPPEYLEAARKVLGTIELDPASSDKAQEFVQAEEYFTAEDDGLTQEWKGRVWMNPPYAKELIGLFINKLCSHFSAGDVPAAVVLINNATETEWFQKAAAACSGICFPDGRVKFLNPEGEPVGCPLQGQSVLYFGKAVQKFLTAFQSFGFCATVPQ